VPSRAEPNCKVPEPVLVSVPPVVWALISKRLPLPTENVLPADAKTRVPVLIKPPEEETAVAELKLIVPAEYTAPPLTARLPLSVSVLLVNWMEPAVAVRLL